MNENASTEILWVNVLRVAATFAVVFLHVSAQVVMRVRDTSSMHWWIGNIADASVRWCIPVFVLLSGFLLLDPSKNEGVWLFYKKRASRIIIPLIFWTVFYVLFQIGISRQFNLTTTLMNILIGAPYVHLWYLYMILGLWLFTPFLRTYIRNSSNRERCFLVIILLLFASIVTTIRYLLFGSTVTIFTIFIPYIGYYICGYQLGTMRNVNFSGRCLLGVFIICAFIGAMGMGIAANKNSLLRGLFFYDYFAPSVIGMSISIFLFVRSRFEIQSGVTKAIQSTVNRIAPNNSWNLRFSLCFA